jgi:hypothetical protein
MAIDSHFTEQRSFDDRGLAAERGATPAVADWMGEPSLFAAADGEDDVLAHDVFRALDTAVRTRLGIEYVLVGNCLLRGITGPELGQIVGRDRRWLYEASRLLKRLSARVIVRELGLQHDDVLGDVLRRLRPILDVKAIGLERARLPAPAEVPTA